MECAVRLAEINNDYQTSAQESSQYQFEQDRWKLYLDQLLAGVTIEENGRKYSLAERLVNDYQEFADFVDIDFDFMAAFKNGEFCEGVNSLIKSEARTLASIIIGG